MCTSRSQFCKDNNCQICFNKSFASHEKAQYWSLDRNELSPRQVFKQANKKFWFKCNVCYHDFELILNNIIVNSSWCSYCSIPPKYLCKNDTCLICFNKSFASHEKAQYWNYNRNILNPRYVFKNSNTKFWFNCNVCFHEFDIRLCIVCQNHWCPLCSSQKLCENNTCQICFDKSFASHEKALYWSDKNILSARQIFKYSNKKCWFNCDNGHNFDINIVCITKLQQWCPCCKHKTEDKLYKWLSEKCPTTIGQVKFDWCKNPQTNRRLSFDFLIDKFKLVIELDGLQHFKQVANWTCPEETTKRDRYKAKCANENGYTVIRLLQDDVFRDKINWQERLLEKIKPYDTPEIHYISTTDCYDNHKKPENLTVTIINEIAQFLIDQPGLIVKGKTKDDIIKILSN